MAIGRGGDEPSSRTDDRHEVVVVRHGQTEWSADGRHTGRTDLPLLPEGVEQARRLQPLLARRSFALVLTSPLVRARDTAAEAGFPDAEVDDDLMEWDYGIYEGTRTLDIRAESDSAWSIWTTDVEGGEQPEEVGARVDRVIARARAAGGDVLMVAHAHVLRILSARWLELPPTGGKHLALAPATVSVLGWEREVPALRQWNVPPS